MVRFWASGVPALLLFAFGVLWTGLMVLQPRAGEPVAAIFPLAGPPLAAFGAVIGAGADAVIGIGAVDSIVVAASNDARFVDRLRDSGAWMVIRAPLAGYCR